MPAPGLLVTGSARVPVESVAEYAVSALLMLLKDFPALSERPQQRPWYTSLASMLHASTVLVVGAGRIGRAVVRRLAALGAHCVAVTRTGAIPVEDADRTVGVDALIDAAASADHVVCCLPGTTETANLVDKDVLAVLPPHAVLVNVGRAATVEDAALHEALRSGALRGALLDVHRVEPLPSDDPAWTVPNLVVSPHRAFAFPGNQPRSGRRSWTTWQTCARTGCRVTSLPSTATKRIPDQESRSTTTFGTSPNRRQGSTHRTFTASNLHRPRIGSPDSSGDAPALRPGRNRIPAQQGRTRSNRREGDSASAS